MKISKDVYHAMIAHLKSAHPQEGCGFLGGRKGKAELFIPVANMDRSSISYEMDPRDQLRAFKILDEKGLELLGIVHSHVASSAFPSQKDKAMATYPEVSYVIASLADMDRPEVKAFRFTEGGVAEEELEKS